MLILPLIDLLILLGTASLGIGGLIKVINLTTRYSPSLFGLNSIDFVVIAAIWFGIALTLVARTWLKINEPRLAALRRDHMATEARLRAAERDFAGARIDGNGGASEFAARGAAGADQH